MIGDSIEKDGIPFDLMGDTEVALTIQAFDMQSIPSVKASTTNQFKLPPTQRNCEMLGFANIEAASTSIIRQLLKNITLKNAGLPIIINGSMNVTGFDGEFFNCILNSNNKNFWDAIDKKYLSDLNFSSINGKWDNARRDSQRANTTDLCSALISTGQLLAGTPVDNFTNGSANPPVIYLSYIVTKIFELAGQSFSGSIFSDVGYLRTAIPCEFIMDSAWLRKKEFSASADGTQVVGGLGAGVEFTVIFQNVQYNGDDLFYNSSTGEWTVVNPDTALDYFSCGFFNRMDITVAGSNVDVLLKKNGTILASTLGVGTSSTTNGTIDAGYGPTKGFKAGDIVKVTIRGTGVSTVTVNVGSVFNAKCFESSDTVKAFEDSWYHYFNYMLPKISLKQVMTEVIMQYNLLSKEAVSGLQFSKFEIIANQLPTDWSFKFRTNIKSNQGYIPPYAQLNYFKWQTGDLEDNVNQGIMEITSDKLPLSNTLFQSSFEGSQMKATFNIFGAFINLWSGVAFVGLTNIRSRFVMVRPKFTAEPQVRFDAAGRNDYQVCYFNDPSQAYNLDWQKFVDSNYTRLNYCLNNYRLVEKIMYLESADINSFDPFTPVLINGQTYIINRIYQYIKGQLVKIQLFKI